MILDRHMVRSKELFGEDFKAVHKWLDYFALEYGRDHRPYRHNQRGVQYIREKWGDTAAMVAKQHILDDGYDTIPQ